MNEDYRQYLGKTIIYKWNIDFENEWNESEVVGVSEKCRALKLKLADSKNIDIKYQWVDVSTITILDAVQEDQIIAR